MKKNILIAVYFCMMICLNGCGSRVDSDVEIAAENVDGGTTEEHPQEETEIPVQQTEGEEEAVQTNQAVGEPYTIDTRIEEVINDPVFGDYGRMIFPVDSGFYSGDTLGELGLTWYRNIDPQETVEIVNYMRNQAAGGKTIFYDIYTDEEKAADPDKQDTGLFFFKGEPGAKFAVCNAGGGFAYVGAMHDSFPHALELSKEGYNAFALIYRPGAQTACEDLARAISFIFEHAQELQIDTDCYSLWGGSAGARMAAWLGSYGPGAFGGDELPQAGAVIMQYTGHTDYTENDPPTYVCVGESDGIANWRTMQNRLDRLSAFGIDTEFHSYLGLGHGFGLGTGTVAEGWFDDAVAFWEKQMENSRILIAYYSQPTDVDTSDLDAVSSASVVVRDGEVAGSTTEYVAKIIQETVGGDLFRIETVDEYPTDYDQLVAQAREERGNDFRPELAEHIENLEQYDTIILGYPSWITDLPMPVYSFLEEYDFGAKTIIPFVTHGGSGFGSTRNVISELQPGAFVSDNGLSVARDDLADGGDEIRQWAESLNLNRKDLSPESSSDTVAGATADPHNQQMLYLWEEGNMPAITEYTENNGYYADDPDFRPYMVTFPVPEGTEVKDAALICAGGAFQFRSDQNEGTPVAQELSELGYQSFVVNYRLRPYTQEEGALDLARAVRFVRKNADVYGIDEKDIAVMGFSAGGILVGEMLLNFDGTVNGTALDADYMPDALDGISADAAADGMIYSFYGRLSVASKDVEKFAASDLPPTYFCYGTRDPFVREFEACIEALREAGVSVEVDVLEGRPHGYGYMEGWIPAYAQWLENVFANN